MTGAPKTMKRAPKQDEKGPHKDEKFLKNERSPIMMKMESKRTKGAPIRLKAGHLWMKGGS